MHENGSISVYSKKQSSTNVQIFSKNKQTAIGEELFNEVDSSFSYCLLVQSDQIRLSKSLQIFGFCVCPVTEKNFGVLLNDGRFLKFKMLMKKVFKTFFFPFFKHC